MRKERFVISDRSGSLQDPHGADGKRRPIHVPPEI